MRRFTILGERCSGTNYLEKAIQSNFDLELTWEYHWKHFFGFSDYENSDDVLFVGIIRDPVQWLCSLRTKPHHLNEEMKRDWNNFMTKECWSLFDKTPENKNSEIEIMDDRNLHTGERYENIFELRKTKALFLMNDMPKKVKNYVFLKYEDLLNNYEKTLGMIEQKFSLKRKNDHFISVSEHYNYGVSVSGRFTKVEYDIPAEYKHIYNNNIDKSTETKLGYIDDSLKPKQN